MVRINNNNHKKCSPSECLETNIYEIWGYKIPYPALNLDKWNQWNSKSGTQSEKMDSGGRKMESGVSKGAREKIRQGGGGH